MNDITIISDIHLGSDACQVDLLIKFLENLQTGILVINGDLFENFDMRRLKKKHWKVLSILRSLSDKVDIYWLRGNHDDFTEPLGHLIGMRVTDELVLNLPQNQKLLILHGHQFDGFLEKYPVITLIADWIYGLLLKIDRTHYIARSAKHSSKTFVRCKERVKELALEKMKHMKCDYVCCGHTHFPECHNRYINSGCWTELPCSYISIKDNCINVQKVTHE